MNPGTDPLGPQASRLLKAAFTAFIELGTLPARFQICAPESNCFAGTLIGNSLLEVKDAADGQTLNVLLTQDATGNRTITWPSNFRWPGGSTGVLSTSAGAKDLLCATYRRETDEFYCTLLKGMA